LALTACRHGAGPPGGKHPTQQERRATDREQLIPIEWIDHIDNKVHVQTRAT
jgi:hypothetical protein